MPLFARKGRFGARGAEKRGGEDGVVTSDGCFAATLTLGGAQEGVFPSTWQNPDAGFGGLAENPYIRELELLGMAAVAAFRPVSDTFSRLSGEGYK